MHWEAPAPELLFGGHGEHVPLPAELLYVFAGQAEHVLPSWPVKPGAHKHCDWDVAPLVAVTLLAGHDVQLLEPAELYELAAHD